jgi:hypothetical protein
MLTLQISYAKKFSDKIIHNQPVNNNNVSTKSDTNLIATMLHFTREDSIVLIEKLQVNRDKYPDYIVISVPKNYSDSSKVTTSQHCIHFILSKKDKFYVYCSNKNLLKDFDYDKTSYVKGLYPSIKKKNNKIILYTNGYTDYRVLEMTFTYNNKLQKILLNYIYTYFDRYQYYDGKHSLLNKKNIDICTATYQLYDYKYNKVW